jgi:LysR family transcriptional regulator, transcriptional activator of the cysJI operon
LNTYLYTIFHQQNNKAMSDFRLKVFCSVAHNLSFTKASQELFISQPAISKHIQELEAIYQTRLFDRIGNKISLTTPGQLLLDHSTKILDDYNELDFEMNRLRNKYTGELRLGASTTISQYVLPPLLAHFIERYPQISLSLFNGNSREIENALQNHRIDLGLVEGIYRLPNLKYSLFLKDELVPVVRTNGKLAKKDEITIQELQSIPLVLRERGSGTLDVLEASLQQFDLKLSSMNVLMYLGSTESIKLFLESTECMGIVSIRAISREIGDGRFKVIDIKDLRITRDLDFVQLQGDENGPIKLFTDFTRRYKQKL